MTQTKRKILFFTFFLIFIIATPLILMYAMGYKVGSDFKLQKTGILIIETKPSGAKIFLNGKIQKSILGNFLNKEDSYIKTPAKIKNMKPGNYVIRLELDNYWAWEKKLTINEGQSTFIEDVNFFKNDSATIINNNEFDNITITKDKNFILGQNNDNIIMIDTGSEDYKVISTSSEQTFSTSSPYLFNLSPSNQRLATNISIINLIENKTELLFKNSIGENPLMLKWISENEIVYKNNNSINIYNTKDGSLTKIIEDENIQNIQPKENFLYYITVNSSKSVLNIYNLKSREIFRKINLPQSDYDFINTDHYLLNLYDKSLNILYLIDPFSHIKPLKETISNVTLTQWVDNDKLLYSNDFEIWIFDLINYKKILLTRISKKINKIMWHPSNNYVIFSTDKNINIIELDDREKRNITPIIEMDHIKDLQMNSKGNVLYFYGESNESKGIQKLLIQ